MGRSDGPEALIAVKPPWEKEYNTKIHYNDIQSFPRREWEKEYNTRHVGP
jgi:hypothetical protein